LLIVRDRMARAGLTAIAAEQFGDMVKAVVDVRRGIMALAAISIPAIGPGGWRTRICASPYVGSSIAS